MSTVKIKFILPSKEVVEVDAMIGLSILEVAHLAQKIGSANLAGSCEGSLACSTCHVILDEAFYNTFPPATEDEEDMLDLAFGLTPTSRLGCQLIVKPEHAGMTFTIPTLSRNN